MTEKFNVDGAFENAEGKGVSSQLPARQEILPPVSSQKWQPRSAEHINVPSPTMRRTLFGRLDHAGFQEELREVEQSEKAITSLTQARTQKEQALTEYERTLAKRQLMPAILEQDRVAVLGDVALAQSALRRTLQHITRQEQQDAQGALNDSRLRELETIEYETELARKRQVLAEERAKAANIEEIAALKAKAQQAKAERELREEEAEREKAHQKFEQAKRGRLDHEIGAPDEDPPEFRRAMANQRKHQDIARAAAKREAAILAEAGGDEMHLDADARDELESIRQAKARAQEQVDRTAALGAIFPYGDDGEEHVP